MSVFFTRRGGVAGPKPIPVTITKSGDGGKYASVTIKGTTYYDATDGLEVVAGDYVDYMIRNISGDHTVTADGVIIRDTVSNSINSGRWTVPDGITDIAIFLVISDTGGDIVITTT